MFVITRKELKGFDINVLMPGDVLVIRNNMKEDRPSDYFIQITPNKATVTTRYNIGELCDFQMPRYVRYLVEDLAVRLGFLRRSKFRVGDTVRCTNRKKAWNKTVRNVIANTDGEVFYTLGNSQTLFPQKLFREDVLEAVVRNITPFPA